MIYDACCSSPKPQEQCNNMELEMMLTKKKYTNKEVRMLLTYQEQKLREQFQNVMEREGRYREERRQNEEYWKLRDDIFNKLFELQRRVENIDHKEEKEKEVLMEKI